VRDWLLGVAASCTASCIYRRCSESEKRVENRLQQSPNRNEESPLTGCWSLVGHWPLLSDGRLTDALFSRLSRPGEHLAPQRWLGSLGRPTSRPLKHSHLKKHTAVARGNGRKGAGQPRGAPARDRAPAAGYPRLPLASHEVKHLDHLVSRSSYRVKLLLQLPKRVPAPSFSTGLVLSSVDTSLRRQGTQGTR
jgi:hypothetical protein